MESRGSGSSPKVGDGEVGTCNDVSIELESEVFSFAEVKEGEAETGGEERRSGGAREGEVSGRAGRPSKLYQSTSSASPLRVNSSVNELVLAKIEYTACAASSPHATWEMDCHMIFSTASIIGVLLPKAIIYYKPVKEREKKLKRSRFLTLRRSSFAIWAFPETDPESRSIGDIPR
jgi:hypothetical protein